MAVESGKGLDGGSVVLSGGKGGVGLFAFVRSL